MQRPRVVRRSDHHDVAQVPGDRSEATLQERAQEDLAQFRIGLHEVEQLGLYRAGSPRQVRTRARGRLTADR